MQADIIMRPANSHDREALETIRAAAFAPVFQSFQQILGEVIYAAAQAHEDADQANVLASLLQEDSDWHVYVAERKEQVLGFVSVKLDREHGYGEIGLNAVAPAYAGQGIGTLMYEFSLACMREAGMKVATVATGGDPSHAPARRAYEKAGFNVSIPSVWLCREL